MKTRWTGRLMVLVFVLLLSAGCIAPITQSPATNRTTDTSSNSFATDAEKVAFLEQYVRVHSAVDKAEFRIIYHDNSTGRVPGPSDWDIRAVMHVADTAAWIKDKTQREPFDLAWAEPFYRDDLHPSGEPQFYESAESRLAIFEAEQIVLFYATTTGE
ncbi:MAG: hypothetical protein U0175_37990 [Caldilineaceae bacterium]